MPIDTQSMVVRRLKQRLIMKIYGGEDWNAHKWKSMVKISKAHRYPIYGGKSKIPINV